jgi:nickel superoxide dismutase
MGLIKGGLMFKELVLALLPTAYAHCDVPCGIYDPKGAQTAAETIIKMVEKIEALPKDNLTIEDQNSLVRYIWTKEEHARIGKHELTVLWADFFKPEHLETFPDLHDTFWKAIKAFSHNKQHVDLKAAQDLKTQVDQIADMFHQAKAAKKS